MKSNLLFAALLFPILTFAQVNLVVVDSITNQPIPYSNVYSFKTHNWLLADSLGIAGFTAHPNKLTLTCIGYQTKTLNYRQGQEKILLSPKTYPLEPVRVGTPEKRVTLGFSDNPKTIIPKILMGMSTNKVSLAVYIKNPNPRQTSYITSIKARIRTDERHQKAKIRLHLYRFDPNSLMHRNVQPIGQELTKNNIIYTVARKHGVKTFTIKAPVKLQKNGILVGIELLNDVEFSLRCGREKDLDFNHNYGVLPPKIRNKTLTQRVFHLHGKKKYPMMIGIEVARY